MSYDFDQPARANFFWANFYLNEFDYSDKRMQKIFPTI